MKQNMLKVAVAMLSLSPLSHAANYAVSNNTGFGTNAYLTSSGDATLAGAFLGNFSINDGDIASISSSTDLVNSFNLYNTGGFNAPTPPLSLAGTFGVSGSVPVGSFNGSNIYLLSTDSRDIGSATEFGVVKLSNTFNVADDANPNPIDITLNAGAGTVLAGDFGVVQFAPSPLNPTGENDAFRTAQLVPEPSVALLGALGVLGLLRRRR
mgnify:CR=1 FL=1